MRKGLWLLSGSIWLICVTEWSSTSSFLHNLIVIEISTRSEAGRTFFSVIDPSTSKGYVVITSEQLID